jgi:phage shock protein E
MSSAKNKFAKTAIAAIAAIGLLFAITACAPTAKPLDMTKVTAVIDVRTPDEFAAGHLERAINIDVEGADFAGAVSSLDKAGTYVLYCHSGRRAGIALDTMTGLGFKNLTNAGGIEDAAKATGLAIVQ